MSRAAYRHASAATLVLAWVLAYPAVAQAHGLGVTCRHQGKTILVEAYFDDNSPASDSKVSLLDQAGALLHQRTTTSEGRCVFPVPPPGRYQVAVDAGQGHLVKRWITVGVAAAPGTQISEGPSREEFTRFPWLKAALGIAAIAGLGGTIWLARKRKVMPSDMRGSVS